MTVTDKSSRISATELARNLSDILNRIQYRGESFIIERNGAEVARLGPSLALPEAPTLAELADRMRDIPLPHDGFGDELAFIRANQPTVKVIDWP